MISEAEQLLNDMCSLYCPEKWTMFSANAVSLLAECQKSLNLDSKYPTACSYSYNYTVYTLLQVTCDAFTGLDA